MKEEELHKIIETIKAVTTDSIEKTVNGKINNLSKKLDDHLEKDEKWKDDDKKWKDTVTPLVPYLTEYTEISSTVSKVNKFIHWLSKMIVAIGIIAGVKHFW